MGERVGAGFRDAMAITAVAATVGLGFNALRPDGIPWVADAPYALVVPCPVDAADIAVQCIPANDVSADHSQRRAADVLWVDAREAAQFGAWHISGAINVPYDYLNATDEDAVARILDAGAGVARVLVYGDGGDPDPGRELAKDLLGLGIRNVMCVSGGAPALRSQTGAEGTP